MPDVFIPPFVLHPSSAPAGSSACGAGRRQRVVACGAVGACNASTRSGFWRMNEHQMAFLLLAACCSVRSKASFAPFVASWILQAMPRSDGGRNLRRGCPCDVGPCVGRRDSCGRRGLWTARLVWASPVVGPWAAGPAAPRAVVKVYRNEAFSVPWTFYPSMSPRAPGTGGGPRWSLCSWRMERVRKVGCVGGFLD